jgi:hypothetical protein
MSTNPFAGTDFEQSWGEGFVAGYLAPDDDHPAPTPLTTDQQIVYSEGVLAGQVSIQGIRIPLTTNVDRDETWGIILHGGVEATHLGHSAFEIAAQVAAGEAVAGTIGAALIFTFASVAIFGPTPLPFLEGAAAEAVRKIGQQLHEDGFISDDIELFMAACIRTDHEHDPAGDDELTKRGWWHGRVFLNFEDALAEGKKHEHADETRVLRFQTVAPDILDAIELTN